MSPGLLKHKGKKMARTINTTTINGVNARVINVSKKIETPTGAKVTRSAVVNLRSFSDLNEVLTQYSPEQVFAFTQAGMASRARAIANGKLMTGGLDKDGRALLRSFRETLVNFMDVMELSKEDAIAKLMAPKKDGSASKFATLEDAIKSLEKSDALVFDYVSENVPVPGDDDDESEDDADSDDTK